MDIFEHMTQIDKNKNENNVDKDIFNNYDFSDSSNNVFLHKQVYWTHNNPWDVENDSDFDGISDALDYHVGPGAFDD